MYLKSNYCRYIIKLITIILLAFAIPFSGYANSTPNFSYPMFHFGLSGGLNVSKVNYDDVFTDYLTSGQLSFEVEALVFSDPKNAKSALVFGISYDSKKYNILNSSNKNFKLQSSYLTIPVKYQHLLFDIENVTPFNILLGGFFSQKINEKSIDKNIEYLPKSNYGIILGTSIFHFFNNGMYVFIEYNFQYGFATLDNTVANTGNISHLINFGFKFPSTIF